MQHNFHRTRLDEEVRTIIAPIPRAHMRAKRDGKTVLVGSYELTEAAKQEIRQALEAAGFNVEQNPHEGALDLLIVTRSC